MPSPELLTKINMATRWPSPESDQIPNRPNFRAWNIQPRDSLNDLSWSEAVNHIAGWGILAANAHNKQPWIVNIDKENKTLNISPDTTTFGKEIASDKSGRQAHIGIGCFTENISLALQAYGIDSNPNITTLEKSTGEKTAQILFDLSNIQQAHLTYPELFDLIKIRRSYRGPTQYGVPINSEVENQLKTISTDPTIYLNIRTSPFVRTQIAIIQGTANNIVLNLPDFRNELGHHMKPNDTLETRVMPGNNFGFDDQNAQELSDALQSGGLFPIKFASGFTSSIVEATKSCSGIGIISTEKDNPEHWIKAGQLLQRTWLYLQSQGFGLWVMAGTIEAAPMTRNSLKATANIKNQPEIVFVFGKPKRDFWPHAPREENIIRSK